MNDRWPALDGLRGIAVLLVVADHAGLTGGQHYLGLAGVHIFFVLSGFLITRVILASRERGDWSFGRFLAARAVRLVPALIVMELVVLIWWVLLGFPWAPILRETGAATLYLTNFMYGDATVLRHTWSLAVEEQFYLLWPLALPLVIRSRRPAMWLFVGVLGSVLLRMWTAAGDGSMSSLPVNVFALLIGGMVALERDAQPGRLQRWTPALAVVVIVAAMMLLNPPSPFVVMPPLVAMVAAVAVATCVPGAALLQLPALRFLGRVSYAWYLWHWPVLALSGTVYDGLGALPAVAISLLVAVASTTLLEEPLRRRFKTLTRKERAHV